MKRWALFLTPSLLFVAYLAAQPDRSRWGERADKPFVPRGNLRIDGDLVYARYGKRSLDLDLYRPAKVSRDPIPGVVVIRGGGWQHGDSHGYAFIASYLAQSGFAAACIQYRTSTEARFPAAVQDAKTAVRWLRANAAEDRIDPGALGAIGGSPRGEPAPAVATPHRRAGVQGGGGEPRGAEWHV